MISLQKTATGDFFFACLCFFVVVFFVVLPQTPSGLGLKISS